MMDDIGVLPGLRDVWLPLVVGASIVAFSQVLGMIDGIGLLYTPKSIAGSLPPR